MTKQGFIKLYRKLQENQFYKNSEAVHLWIHLLFSASYEDNVFYYKNTKINVKRGQLITGRKKLAYETGIKESNIYRLLKMYENEHQIEQQTTNKYSIITILSFDDYNVIEQQKDSKRTTNEQQMNTTKEIKEIEYIYNMYNEICVNLPKAGKLNDDRKKKIKARLKQLSNDEFKNLFIKANNSSFLTGSSGWKANLDWLIKNDKNYLKVLEGNYDDKKENNIPEWKKKGGLF